MNSTDNPVWNWTSVTPIGPDAKTAEGVRDGTGMAENCFSAARSWIDPTPQLGATKRPNRIFGENGESNEA